MGLFFTLKKYYVYSLFDKLYRAYERWYLIIEGLPMTFGILLAFVQALQLPGDGSLIGLFGAFKLHTVANNDTI